MPILETKQLTFEVQGRKILSQIDLSVKQGEFLSIIGASGSGKSTLLKILSSIVSKTDGDIFYKKKAIEKYDPVEYRKEISYFFQTPVLFGNTVKDNLSFPYEIRNEKFNQEKAIEFLEDLGLHESYLDKEINNLSGGEKQRVAVIRNILYQPKVLLLDEITSGLDSANRSILWDWLKKLKKKDIMTVLMVSHNEDELALADRSIKIVDGKIVS